MYVAVCPAGMCSSRGLCGSGGDRPNRSSSSEGSGSGAHYALCALGVGLVALGVVMIVWTVIPMDGENSATGNSTNTGKDDEEDDDGRDTTKSSTVAMVLVGVGAALLLLSICLGVRNKRNARNRSNQPAPTGGLLMGHVVGQEEES